MTELDTTIAHEAGHAAALRAQGIPVYGVSRVPSGRSLGHTLMGLEGSAENARKYAIALLAGPAAADEPLPTWPLRPRMRGDDVHLLAIFCDFLKLDESGFDSLVDEMHELTFTTKFRRLFTALVAWLEEAPRLDRAMIAQAQTIAWR